MTLDILVISLGAEAAAQSPASPSKLSTEPAKTGEVLTKTTTDDSSELPAAPRAPNSFVLRNAAKVQRLIGPCLRADTNGIRQRLLRFVERMAALYYADGQAPPEFQDAAIWPNLHEALEHRMEAAVAEKAIPPQPAPTGRFSSGGAAPAAPATPAAAAAASGTSGGAGGGTEEDGTRSKALLSVRIVEAVSQVHPPFADEHASTLLELVRVLSRQHFAQAAALSASMATRCGGSVAAAVVLPPALSGSEPTSPSTRLLPTPSMAVLNTAITVEVMPDDPSISEHLEVRLLRSLSTMVRTHHSFSLQSLALFPLRFTGRRDRRGAKWHGSI